MNYDFRMGTAYYWLDKLSAQYKVRAPFNRACVEVLKTTIPVYGRRWDPDGRVWEVDPQFFSVLLSILRKYYADVRELPAPTKPTESSVTTTLEQELLALAQDSTLVKIYRLIAFDVHPDHGGNTVSMQRLNALWEQLRARRGLA